jgi:hypothetical protein
LINSENPEEGQMAFEIYGSIMKFAEFDASISKYSEEVALQNLIKICKNIQKAIDDFYLQIVKFTSDFRDIDTKEAINLWKIFAVASTYLRPTNPDVIDYVKAHLRKNSVADHRSLLTGKIKKEEINYAKYCFIMLQKCLTIEPRKKVPSLEEIRFTSVNF